MCALHIRSLEIIFFTDHMQRVPQCFAFHWMRKMQLKGTEGFKHKVWASGTPEEDSVL
jgi:hypothetical protein